MKILGIDLKSEEIALSSSNTEFITNNKDYQPMLGIININIDFDFSIGNSLEYFEIFMFHELTHILGFSWTYFSIYFSHSFSKI